MKTNPSPYLLSLLIVIFLTVGCSRQTEQESDHTDHPHSHDHDHDHGPDCDHHHHHGHGPDDAIQHDRAQDLHDLLDHARHHGVSAPLLSGGKPSGFCELKLHDDKGDLELWITKDQAGATPFDLPLDSTITVTFPKLDNKQVTLAVRNTEKNEDEDGNGNIRENKTHYFIFPGDTGADASFLLGKEFSSPALISFTVEGVEYTTESFKLYPHSH